jgi:excisionase family DNA binding protein
MDKLGMTRPRLDAVQLVPRGLSADEAARYIGIGRTKFDELVDRGKMPKPKRIDGRIVFDRYALDAAFTDLPEDKPNQIDQLFGKTRVSS